MRPIGSPMSSQLFFTGTSRSTLHILVVLYCMYSVTNRCKYKHDEKQVPFDKEMRALQAEAQKKERKASKTEQQESNKRDRDGHQSKNRNHERESRAVRERKETERQEVAQYKERSRARLEEEQQVLRAKARREEREAQSRQHELQQEEHRKERDAVEQQGEQASNKGDWGPQTTLAEAANDTFSFADPEPSEEEDDDRAEQETTKGDRTGRRHTRSTTQRAVRSDLSERKTFKKRSDRGSGRSDRDSGRSDHDSGRSNRDRERNSRGREGSSRDSERGDRDKGKSKQDRERADRDKQEKRAGDQSRKDATASVRQGLDTISEHRATTDIEQECNIVWRSKTGGSPKVVRKLGYGESGDDEPEQATKRTLVLQWKMRGERALEAMRKSKPLPNFGRITMFEAIAMVAALYQNGGNANTKLNFKDAVTKLHVGIYPPDKDDRYEFAITLLDSYYNKKSNARRALEALRKGGDSALSKAITLAARETCIVGYARPGNDEAGNVLAFRDNNGAIMDVIVSPLGLVSLSRVAEGLEMVCASPRITMHEGEMEVLFVQFPDTVDMASVPRRRYVGPWTGKGCPKRSERSGTSWPWPSGSASLAP